MAKAKELIARVLAESGIQHVFGLPGGGTLEIFDGLYDQRERVTSILVRHEHGASIMADAYARAAGRPALIMGQGAFIGSNAAFGVMEAFVSGSPMVIITDTSDGLMPQHPANQSVTGDHGSPDIVAIFRAMTKYTTLAATAKEAVIGTQLAIKHATSGRPGPAAVVFRSQAVLDDVDEAHAPYIHPTAGYLPGSPAVAAEDDVVPAAELLINAANPVIVAGNGVHLADAHQDLRRLAELLGAAVATTYKGKSAIAETHPLAVGMVGVFGQEVANAVVGDADVVLVVGAKLTPQDTVRERPAVFDPARQRILQVDIDPHNAGWTFPVERALIGDAQAVLAQLVAACEATLREDPLDTQARSERLAAIKRARSYYEHPTLHGDTAPPLPPRLVRLVQESVDPETLIALDAGNNRVWMCHFYQAQQAKTFFCPGGLAGMGWALPAALGLKVAQPHRPVLGVTGDGGFMISVHAIATAVQYALPVVWLVMNDSSLGMVRQHQKDRLIASEFGDVDHARIARGFGADGLRVDDARDILDALRSAFASGHPTVIDAVIDRTTAVDDFRVAPRRASET